MLQTWRDHKSKVSEKVQKLRKASVSTGDNSIEMNLTELDKRILGIIGYEYMQDFTNVSDSCNVSDSLPEDHNVSKKIKNFMICTVIHMHIYFYEKYIYNITFIIIFLFNI